MADAITRASEAERRYGITVSTDSTGQSSAPSSGAATRLRDGRPSDTRSTRSTPPITPPRWRTRTLKTTTTGLAIYRRQQHENPDPCRRLSRGDRPANLSVAAWGRAWRSSMRSCSSRLTSPPAMRCTARGGALFGVAHGRADRHRLAAELRSIAARGRSRWRPSWPLRCRRRLIPSCTTSCGSGRTCCASTARTW